MLPATSELAAHVQRLEDSLRTVPQVECLMTHFVDNGMYYRSIFIPKGTVLTGRRHLYPQRNIVLGDIAVTTDSGVQRLTGYNTVDSIGGSKRAGVTFADTIWTTICKLSPEQLLLPLDALADVLTEPIAALPPPSLSEIE